MGKSYILYPYVWETGTSYPDITVLPELAMILNCTVNDFFVNKKSQAV